MENTRLVGDVTSLGSAWLITRTDGEQRRFTTVSEDIDIDIGDGKGVQTYSASEGYSRSNFENDADLNVGNMDVVGVFDNLQLDETDLRRGIYDFADIKIFFFDHQDTSTTVGIVKIMRGTFGRATVSPAGFFNITLRDLTTVYSDPIGERISKDCKVDLGSDRCGVPIDPPVLEGATNVTVGEFYKIPTDKPAAASLQDPVGLTNGGFETGDLTGWTVTGTWAITATPGPGSPFEGSWAARSTTASPLPGLNQIIDLRSSQSGPIPDADLLEGNVVLSVTIRAAANGSVSLPDGIGVRLKILDSTDTQVAVSSDAKVTGPSGGVWQFVGTKMTLPITAAKVDLEIFSTNAAGGIDISLDDVQLAYTNPNVNVLQEWFENKIYVVKTAGLTQAEKPVYDETVGNDTTDGVAVLTAEDSWSRHAVVSAVDSGSPRRIFTVTELTPNTGGPRGGFPDDWFNGGAVLFITGNNITRAKEVRDFVADDGITITQDIELFEDMPFDIVVGDKLRIFPGCDKIFATCRDKFGNSRRFNGEPYITTTDILGQYPDAR
jgi:hypothetical protein